MLTPNQFHEYQKQMILHQLYNPNSMLWGFMGSGKLQPLSEPILTPSGWDVMGNMETGSFVIGSNGDPVLVTNTFDHKNKKIYKVIFNDGSYTRCGGKHLWYVEKPYQKKLGYKGQVLSTDDIINHGVKDKFGNNNFSIPMVEPINYIPRNLTINPYLLGVILGDGTCAKTGYTILCTDIETIKHCNLEVTRPHSTSCYTAYSTVKGISDKIISLNLAGKRSWEKHIPSEYLIGSVSQRLKLLQGLLDTDGHAMKCGGVEFSSTSENLIDGVVELAQSLGGTGRKSKPRVTKHQGGEGRVSWRVNVKLPDQFDPFILKRKLDKWVRPTKYKVTRYISKIIDDGFEDSRCITIDSIDSLYATRNHILTHNTAVTLTTIDHRVKTNEVQKTLVIAPLRVASSVWENEARKWSHLNHLTFSLIHGNDKKKKHALFSDADIYLINYEGLPWLVEQLLFYYIKQNKPIPFQFCVYDEVSKLKNSQSVRFKGGKREVEDSSGKPVIIKTEGFKQLIPHFKFTTGLTGTPSSNGYLDLFGQYLAVDNGERLGKYITHYRDNYFISDYMGWAYKPTDMGKKLIEQKIQDITLSMNDPDKYLDLPKVVYKELFVELTNKAKKHYCEIEKELFTVLDNGQDLELFNAASVSNKCLQICNGSAYYDNDGSWEKIHDEKLDALDEVLEDASGQPVLCSYNFKSDAERIMKKFKKYKPVNLTGEKSSKTASIIKKWNKGEIKLLIGHPASMGHGVDGLQKSGSIVVWFGLPWSLELYLQMNARIDRQGQKQPVSIIHILAKNTIDQVVLETIKNKTEDQQSLKDAIHKYRSTL